MSEAKLKVPGARVPRLWMTPFSHRKAWNGPEPGVKAYPTTWPRSLMPRALLSGWPGRVPRSVMVEVDQTVHGARRRRAPHGEQRAHEQECPCGAKDGVE